MVLFFLHKDNALHKVEKNNYYHCFIRQFSYIYTIKMCKYCVSDMSGAYQYFQQT